MNPAFHRLPPSLARAGKRLIAGPRHRWQVRQARKGMRAFGSRYDHEVVFIAGLPKSGSTWLKQMVCSFPGHHEVMPPEANRYELAHGESHGLELEAAWIRRLAGTLAVVKTHVRASERTVAVLKETSTPVMVLYRDVRDVAVSYVAYVARTPWHPEHERYRGRPMLDGIRLFADTHLAAYVGWVVGWHAAAPELGALELTYRSMLADPLAALASVAQHLGMNASDQEIRDVVHWHSFQARTGRAPGQESRQAFRRKGVVGDWKNHFDPALAERFAEAMRPLEGLGVGVERAGP